MRSPTYRRYKERKYTALSNNFDRRGLKNRILVRKRPVKLIQQDFTHSNVSLLAIRTLDITRTRSLHCNRCLKTKTLGAHRALHQLELTCGLGPHARRQPNILQMDDRPPKGHAKRSIANHAEPAS